jgi:DNA (cytosine-5)-methyltransferase 1
MFTVGSLFSGIGGMDLGLERAGGAVIWQSEIDPYACRVLAKHWPNVPNLGDIRDVRWETVEAVDIVAGGFPCQDVSDAGDRAGIDGERSGLWTHFAAAIRHIRPRYVLVENVPGLLVRGMGRVVGDLASMGYDAEWDCIPAAAVGAPHLRARIWILAYPRGERGQEDDAVQTGRAQPELSPWWEAEPAVGRVADGLPRRLAGRANRANGRIGNAVVPQVAELIGRRIMEVAA